MKRTIYLIFIGIMSIFALTACGNDKAESTDKPALKPVEVENPSEVTVSEPKAPIKTESVPADRGPVLYKRCKTCHTLEKNGRHKVGPNLYGIFGAKIGAKEGFNYSKAFQASDIVWTDENLAAYIAKPRTYIPGNKMTFVGIRKSEDIDILLEYMRTETTE